MEKPKCPKCGSEKVRTWTNKRRQLVGMCDGCGKLVSFGRPKGNEEDAGKKTGKEESGKKTAAKTAPRAAGSKTAKPAGSKLGGKGDAAVHRSDLPAIKAGQGFKLDLAGAIRRFFWD